MQAGCVKRALGNDTHCKQHAPITQCHQEGCSGPLVGMGQFCTAHAIHQHQCVQPGCVKRAFGKNTHCKQHAPIKQCQLEGCSELVNGFAFCTTHGNGKRERDEPPSEGYQCMFMGSIQRCLNPVARNSRELCSSHDLLGGTGAKRTCIRDGCCRAAIRSHNTCSQHVPSTLRRHMIPERYPTSRSPPCEEISCSMESSPREHPHNNACSSKAHRFRDKPRSLHEFVKMASPSASTHAHKLRRCEKQGCSQSATSDTSTHCEVHAPVKNCHQQGCSMPDESRTQFCTAHAIHQQQCMQARGVKRPLGNNTHCKQGCPQSATSVTNSCPTHKRGKLHNFLNAAATMRNTADKENVPNLGIGMNNGLAYVLSQGHATMSHVESQERQKTHREEKTKNALKGALNATTTFGCYDGSRLHSSTPHNDMVMHPSQV